MAEELVWLRLTLDARRLPLTNEDTADGLRARFHVAERGYADVDEPPAAQEAAPDPLTHHRDQREEEVAFLISDALGVVGVRNIDAEAVRLRALVDGLVRGVCLGRLTPAEAVTVISGSWLRAKVQR